MDFNLEEIKQRLIMTGLNEDEADILLFKFLYRYAFEFVRLANIAKEDMEKYNKIVWKDKA